jgi:hypothetical protein
MLGLQKIQPKVAQPSRKDLTLLFKVHALMCNEIENVHTKKWKVKNEIHRLLLLSVASCKAQLT